MIDTQNRAKNDIYNIPIVRFIFKNPTFIFILKTIILALFIYAIVLGFVEPTKKENTYTTMLFWTLFWPFFIVITLPSLGRVFCGICPHGFLGKYITRYGLKKKMPKFLENRYIGIALIIIGFWAVYYIAPGTYKTPFAAAIFFSVLTLLAIIVFYLYKDMSYCKSICPIGSLLRGFSKVSFTKLQTYSDSCKECKTFECAKACGYNLKPFTFEKRNSMTDCTLCMDCSSACEAVGFHITKPSKPLLNKFSYNKPEIWAIILITAAISVTMSFHHALGRVAISDEYIWSKTGVWLQSTINIQGLDFIGISAFFYAILITVSLAIVGMKIGSIVLNEKYDSIFYTLSYAFIPLFIIGGLSHTFEFFFLHHYSNIINGFIDGFNLNMQNVAPLATRKDKWLHFFNIMNYIAVIWAMFILYKRVNFFKGTITKKTITFLFAGLVIWFYLFLQVYKGYAFSTYGVKKMGHHNHASHKVSNQSRANK